MLRWIPEPALVDDDIAAESDATWLCLLGDDQRDVESDVPDRGVAITRQTLTASTFVEIVDTLVGEFDVIDVLTLLTSRCVELLDAAAAGILLADGDGHLRVIGASNEQARLLELFQVQHDEGPCLDCFRSGEVVHHSDLDTLSPWSRFATECTAAGYASVCAIPLRLKDRTLGCLNLFMLGPAGLTGVDVALAQALADVTSVIIVQDEVVRDGEVRTEPQSTPHRGRRVDRRRQDRHRHDSIRSALTDTAPPPFLHVADLHDRVVDVPYRAASSGVGVVGVRQRVIAAELTESFVECHCEHVEVGIAGDQSAVEHRLDFEFGARAADCEVPPPQLRDGKSEALTGSFQQVDGVVHLERSGFGAQRVEQFRGVGDDGLFRCTSRAVQRCDGVGR